MINKIIFTIDFLSHSFENKATYHFWFIKLLKRIIYLASDLEIIELKEPEFLQQSQFVYTTFLKVWQHSLRQLKT